MLFPRPHHPVLHVILLLLLLSVPLPAHSATLQHITSDFGPNPTNVGFFLYVPDTLARPAPPILVNPHWCHGNATLAHAYSSFASLADAHGFVVIFPDSPNAADHCWDVSSPATLSHSGGGDSLGIVSMVRWATRHLGADPARVFVTGVSSGGMMTNVLAGAYPDVFAGASAWADVPFGCFATPSNITASAAVDYWNADCAEGLVRRDGSQWRALVEAAYPAWPHGGWRPRVQVFHGTADETVSYENFRQDIKQWTAVFGLDETPSAVRSDYPLPGWTQLKFGEGGGGDWFEAYSAANVTHNIPVQDELIVGWFGLNCTTGCFSWGQGGPAR